MPFSIPLYKQKRLRPGVIFIYRDKALVPVSGSDIKYKMLWGIVGLLVLVVACRYSDRGISGNSKKEAGRYLFFDNRLSYNSAKSCASCHDPQFAFTDGYRKSITASGEQVLHNAPTLFYMAYASHFDWADPRITSLEQQHRRPLFATTPTELGATGYEAVITARLKSDPRYSQLLAQAFPGDPDPFTFDHYITCIATFVQSLESTRSPYDRFRAGDSDALSVTAQKGMTLFFSNRLQCSSCHSGPFFTRAAQTADTDSIYANTGLYAQYPDTDPGCIQYTHQPKDAGRFKIPTLRNIALTAPYMHDGSLNNLTEVIELYNTGGKGHPNQDKRIRPLQLSPEEKMQIIHFLHSLTDSTILQSPDFQNPFATKGK